MPIFFAAFACNSMSQREQIAKPCRAVRRGNPPPANLSPTSEYALATVTLRRLQREAAAGTVENASAAGCNYPLFLSIGR